MFSIFSNKTHSEKVQEISVIQEKIQDLTAQTVELNDMASKLRALINLSSEKEQQLLKRLEKIKSQQENASKDETEMVEFLEKQVADHWQNALLLSFASRQLYPQLIEFKRRLMHDWVESIQQRISSLDEGSQERLMTSLHNVVQGSLSAGVHHLENQYHQELLTFLEENRTSSSFQYPPEELENWMQSFDEFIANHGPKKTTKQAGTKKAPQVKKVSTKTDASAKKTKKATKEKKKTSANTAKTKAKKTTKSKSKK